MAARTSGIPGIGVTLAAAGAYLVYSGIRNVPLQSGLQDLLRGKLPAGQPSTPTPVPTWSITPGAAGAVIAGVGGSSVISGMNTGVSGLGARIATEAQAHLGVPYRWGGADPSGWDCSGFVTWVLVKVGAGAGLPSQVHTTAAQFLVWSGAATVPRSQCQAGDLCCWAGHIGIAVDNGSMVNAPTFGIPTRVQSIYAGVTIRRLKGA